MGGQEDWANNDGWAQDGGWETEDQQVSSLNRVDVNITNIFALVLYYVKVRSWSAFSKMQVSNTAGGNL